MAELATIARPYAEALFKAVNASEAQSVARQLAQLAQVAADPAMRAFADDPKARPEQVADVARSALPDGLGRPVGNLLRTVVDNGRLGALPEIAEQFRRLVNTRSGIADVVVRSAFPLEGDALAETVAALERRFGRRLRASVQVDPELIGGIRAAVGDEVLDTSVKARLEQMRAALSA